MELISLNEVAEAVNGTLYPKEAGNLIIRGISTDSRSLSSGDLFVPLSGKQFDGHRFIGQAVEKGATAYITEKSLSTREGETTPGICVKSTTGALMNLASRCRKRSSATVIGVTGSNGKTTTKDLLGQVLEDTGNAVYSERSFNNFVGLPATIFRIESDTEYLVLEMGTNSPGEISALTDVAAPEIGIITNISFCHLEGLKDREGIAREKASLLAGLRGRRLSVLNQDDPYIDLLVKYAPGPVVTYGICRRADYTAINIDVNVNGVSFDVAGTRLSLSLLGFHSIYNALAAFACAMELGLDPDRTARIFSEFEGPPMRLKPVRHGSLLVINDTYNANPGSMESAIKTFSVLPGTGRKVVVLGDMLELGEQSDHLHKEVGGHLSCGDFDLVVAVGKRARGFLSGAEERGFEQERFVFFEDTDEAVDRFPGMLNRNDSMLIKGSRQMELERLVDAVLETDF